MKIKVIAIDDHPLILRAITELLVSEPDIQLVATASQGSKLHSLVREKEPDVVILDLGMSTEGFEPIGAVKTLRQERPGVNILVLTGYDDSVYIQALINAGAKGYILKSEDFSLCLPQAIRALYHGSTFYSPQVAEKILSSRRENTLNDQEIAILRLLAQGKSTNRIAETMCLSEKRIRNVLTEIYDKLGADGEGVNSRIVVINKAREMGLL